MKKTPEFQLGDVAKDGISGFKGVVVAITQWLNGCVRITISPEEMKDGKPIESHVFDQEQLVLVRAGKHAVGQPSGGPRNDPGRGQEARR